MASADVVERIDRTALQLRRDLLEMIGAGKAGHLGGSASLAEIVAALYFHEMRFDPRDPRDPDRDRFVLSKGHGVGGFYGTLAEAGILDEAKLGTYLAFDSELPGHPVRQKTPFVEINTGALGHGLSVGVGLALAAKKQGRAARVYVLLGDGELQEGSVWEAAMSAAHFRLDALVAIVDRNGLQLADRTETIMALEPLEAKWSSFGFDVRPVDGNDPGALVACIDGLDWSGGRPHVLVARTVKGKGVSFIEDRPAWHHKIPVGDEVERAIEELE